MGAMRLGNYDPKIEYRQLTIAELEQLSGEGIDVKPEEIRVLTDGTLAYKDSRILVHIRDVYEYHQRRMIQNDLPRFHIAHCSTLEQMKQHNRFDRYVVATRDDGLFKIHRMKNNRIIKRDFEKLNVCQNCLNYLSFDGFGNTLSQQQKLQIVVNFSIKRFFEIFPKSLMLDKPEYRDDSAPLNAYPSKWDSISRQAKAKVNWTCKKCGVNMSNKQYRHFLHVHHKDGLKWNIKEDNLEVLCVKCHANEPLHIHLKNRQDYKEFILEFG